MNIVLQILIFVALVFVCYSLIIINRNIGVLGEIISDKNEDKNDK